MEAAGSKEQAMRQLIGPKGGLPTLKGDLLKLGALLNLDFRDTMKGEEIKELIKPMMATRKAPHLPVLQTQSIQKPRLRARKVPSQRCSPLHLLALLQNLPLPQPPQAMKFKRCWHSKSCGSSQ